MNGKIPAARPIIGEEEKEAVLEVLESGQIAAGPKVDEFEEKFSDYIDVKNGVAVSSGTAAIHTALMACDIGVGDKVIVPSYSFFSSASPVIAVGAEPIFADIEPDTYCIDPEDVERYAEEGADAVIPVHLYGNPADMGKIDKIAEEHDLKVIEDACQAHGAELDSKKVGSLGDVGCFSFYATKNMVTGEGGMLTTDDDKIAEKARLLRAHGRSERGEHVLIGHNFLMTDVEAAIGLVQLEKLDEFNNRRRDNAKILNEELEGLEEEEIVKRPMERDGYKHVYHQYALRVNEDRRDRLVNGMQKAGIHVRKGYERPIYDQKAIKLDEKPDCPETEKACREIVWIPSHPLLDVSHMRRAAWGIKQFLG